VPAWVMPLHRVWDTVKASPEIFDVIIVDEASQCGLEALPLFYLAKRIIIVGDDKQISPESVGIDRNTVNALMKQFLKDFQFSSSFDVESSLFDQGKLRYGRRQVSLREHFRCMPEIIKFSNDLCYSASPLIPLRQYGPDRLTPLKSVYISNGWRRGSDSKAVNEPEADAIASTIAELCKDSSYKDRTMGVISLQGDAHAGLIERRLLDIIGAEEISKRRLICGNPYSFQGDQRDVIFLSMVASPNETIGALARASDERRFNVAASRARDQMWLFNSVTVNDLSSTCMRRRLLEFFQNTEIRKVAGMEVTEIERHAQQDNRSIVKPPAPFRSWFEVDVALEIARRGYNVIPAYKVAEKEIDLVIEGGISRLAVECDGDHWHGLDEYEKDMERQRILERCGWEFYRIRECEFYLEQEKALKRLWIKLEERNILPQVRSSKIVYDTVVTQEEEKSERLNRIEIGSYVTYFNEKDNREAQALISSAPSKPAFGTINPATPIAKALLGATAGETVIAHLPSGDVKLKVLRID
ncbi:MAG: AAA family ATPase, partial [Calditrichaeota bacterium]|nr:AAA family ATPase [Calditrichota bacterium]